MSGEIVITPVNRLRILHVGDFLVSGHFVITPVDPCENIACKFLIWWRLCLWECLYVCNLLAAPVRRHRPGTFSFT